MSQSDAAREAYRAEKQALQELQELHGEARRDALDELRARDTALAAVVARRLALSDTAPPESAPANTEPPRIPRYTILQEIGRGGMGRVWQARRADAADAQQLAIKQIRADLGDAETLRRFEAERRILSRLDHPHIVPLLDAGTDADGRPFLVTAFVEGHPIDAYCRDKGLNVAARVSLVRDVVAALAHAHRQLIVHRDLKPANVLVDHAGRVRLLDFGIAKMLDAGPEVTAAGQSLMTLRYAAPEQVSGGALGVGCDLYAIGVLLYELLSGLSPYGELRDPAALVHAIAHQEAPPLPQRNARGEALPRDLAAIVAMLLRKRPEQRYGSAEALADELERWQAGEPVLAMRGQRGYQMQRWLRRRWPWVAAATLLLGFGAFHTWRLDRQLDATARERDKAQVVADYFVTLFDGATPNAARSGEISARALLAGGVERLKALEQGEHSPQALAALLLALGRVHSDLGLAKESADLNERAVAALRGQDDALALADALRAAATSYYELDRKRDYLARSREALAVLEQARATDNTLYPRLLGNVGIGHFLVGEFDQAWAHLDRGRAQMAAGLPESRGDYVKALTNAGGLASTAGEQERARTLLIEAETQVTQLQPRDTDQELFIARNLASVARDTGRLDEARARYDTLVAASLAFHGTGHPELMAALIGRAETAVAQARYADALRDLDAAREHGIQSLPPEHGQFTDLDGLRAIVHVMRGEFSAARPLLESNLARRAGEAVVETQPRLEAAALARAHCGARGNGAEIDRVQALLQETGNVSPWQRALVDRWAKECAVVAVP